MTKKISRKATKDLLNVFNKALSNFLQVNPADFMNSMSKNFKMNYGESPNLIV